MLTCACLVISLQVGSSLVGIVVVIAVFVFPIERALKKSASRGRLRRIGNGDCGAWWRPYSVSG